MSDWSSDGGSSDLGEVDGARLRSRSLREGEEAAHDPTGTYRLGLDYLECARLLVGWEGGQQLRIAQDCSQRIVQLVRPALDDLRSEERRVGKEWVSTGRCGWWPVH